MTEIEALILGDSLAEVTTDRANYEMRLKMFEIVIMSFYAMGYEIRKKDGVPDILSKNGN